MRFLVDADMPRATATLLSGYGHVATDVRDIGMGRAKDPEIARYAKDNRLCLVTGDWGFADVRVYPPADYHGIVVVGVPDAASPADILAVLKTLLEQPTIVALLPGRLAIVERHKIRLRPPPP
jgi:predicted nuclease of predicted toxin-antitoxin system